MENNLYSHEFDDEIKAYNAVIKMQEPTSEELKSSFKIIVDMIREKSEIWHGLHGTDVIVEKDAMEDIKEAILALPSLSDTSKYIDEVWNENKDLYNEDLEYYSNLITELGHVNLASAEEIRNGIKAFEENN